MFTRLTKTQKLIMHLTLLFFGIIWLFPIVQTIIQSFNVNGFQNYIDVINHPEINFFRVITNSFIIAITTSLTVVLITSLAAYAFSKMTFRFKNILYYALLVCLAIPAAAVISPLFLTAKNLGLMNSLLSVILALIAFHSPFMLMIMRNYFDTIPNTLLEAAVIDGSSTFRTYLNIVMPLGVPALMNAGVLTFVYSWNEYLLPLIFIRNEDLYTVTLATNYFTSTANQTPEMVGQLYATLVMMTIPSIIIYLLSLKYLQHGLTAGASKE